MCSLIGLYFFLPEIVFGMPECNVVVDEKHIAKLSPAPASAGLRLALFPFDPATHPPTYRDSSFEPTKTTVAA